MTAGRSKSINTDRTHAGIRAVPSALLMPDTALLSPLTAYLSLLTGVSIASACLD